MSNHVIKPKLSEGELVGLRCAGAKDRGFCINYILAIAGLILLNNAFNDLCCCSEGLAKDLVIGKYQSGLWMGRTS